MTAENGGLSDDERRELEELRAEKARREEAQQAQRERAELQIVQHALGDPLDKVAPDLDARHGRHIHAGKAGLQIIHAYSDPFL